MNVHLVFPDPVGPAIMILEHGSKGKRLDEEYWACDSGSFIYSREDKNGPSSEGDAFGDGGGGGGGDGGVDVYTDFSGGGGGGGEYGVYVGLDEEDGG